MFDIRIIFEKNQFCDAVTIERKLDSLGWIPRNLEKSYFMKYYVDES